MAALPAQRPDLLFCPFFHGNKLHPAPGNKRHPLEVNHRLREELRTTALKEHISRKHPACIRMPLSQIFLHSFVRKQERIFKSRRWQMPFAGVLHPLLPPRFTGERVPAHLKRPFLLQHNKYYVVQISHATQGCNHLTTCFRGFQPEFFTKILIKRKKSQK